MKNWMKFALAIGLAVTLSACNTLKGVGQDIENAGEALEEAVDE